MSDFDFLARPDPARVALRELVEAVEGVIIDGGLPLPKPGNVPNARLVLALNAARNALQMGKVLDDIAADPSIGHGHVGSVG